MADLRIVDAPEIPTNSITGQEKLPTGGGGNYSITLDSVADYTKTKKDLADNTSVDGKVNGVRQELNTHIENLLNPHQVTKSQIGLGNVDNTADADKPVSNSTQSAIISAVSPKADKTYVDNQLSFKANKSDVYTKAETYTKQESSDLVNNSISTALTPINTSLDLAKRGIANRYDPLLTYNSGERVVLTNGDIVKSDIDGNVNDPNVNMTGWVKTNSASQIFDSTKELDQERINSRFINVRDKPTLQQIINSFSAQPDPIKRGDILFNSAEDVDVPEQIEINQGRIKLEGRNTVLKWTGTDPTKAVLRVYDSSMTVIKDMVILGDTASPPLAAVLYDNNNAALIGSNEMNVLENVIIGRKVLSDSSLSFRCTYGVYVRPGGYGNNDQFTLRNVAANDTLEAGFFIEGDQHIWSSIENCLANIGKVGFKMGSNMTMSNIQCNRLTEIDVEAVRNIELFIHGLFSEHPKMALKSTGGSIFVRGGKVLKNPTVKEPIIQFVSGGYLSLDGVLFAAASNPQFNYIDYMGGSVKDGGVIIKSCNIANGHKRDYYKIHTATNGWKEHKIDIECSNFVLKTNAPYSDEAKAGATANANSSAVFSSAQASKLGRGKFFHSAVSVPLPDGAQVPVCVDASVYRVHVMNRTAAQISIPDCNVRGMELSGHIFGSNLAPAQDLVFSAGRGTVKVNVPLLGVKKGDYIIPTSTTAAYQAPMYAYATADNVATVVVETMSSVATTLTAQVIGAAKFDESKSRFHAQKQLAETTVASKTYTTVDIDCTGVQIGSHCLVSSSADLSDLLVTAHCSTDGKIRVTIYNPQSTSVIIPVDTILKVCAVF